MALSIRSPGKEHIPFFFFISHLAEVFRVYKEYKRVLILVPEEIFPAETLSLFTEYNSAMCTPCWLSHSFLWKVAVFSHSCESKENTLKPGEKYLVLNEIPARAAFRDS